MSLYWPYLVADYFAAIELIAAVVAVIIFLSSFDDLFVDAWYWTRRIYRAVAVRRLIKPLTAATLREREEQWMAVMLPAWLEADVIAAMVENMVHEFEYRRYVLFIGAYMNDPATIEEVERIRRRYRQLVRVEVDHPGPTCKADCLNYIVKAIFTYEQTHGVEFAGIVLHDSEDVVHPLELKFFNYLLPRKDLIQIPVMSLERHWSELVAGVYMDEFAEWHAKDLVVRESVMGVVPSAGVGTCFSRKAMLTLRADNGDEPFNTQTLTEDYDVGARLQHAGLSSIIARYPVEFIVRRRGWFGRGKEQELRLELPLCVRELFPDTFRTSCRQKARWILGISLQGWQQIGWTGSLAADYFLLRDRKPLVTSLVSVLAYFLAAQFVVFYLLDLTSLWTTRFPSIFATEGWLPWVLIANFVALALRIGQRVYFVGILYGWDQGLMSLPRLVVGNFVNFAATVRAWRIFVVSLVLGKRIAWDKTMHHFPNAQTLGRSRQRLGELLVAWRAVDAEHVDAAAAQQADQQQPLGRILVSQGLLDEETLAEAIAFQCDLPRALLTQEIVTQNSYLLPLELIVRRRLLPIGLDENKTNRVIVAVPSQLSEDVVAEIEAITGKRPIERVARESEIAAGLRLLRGLSSAFDTQRAAPLLGDILLRKRLMRAKDFEEAVERYRPDQDGRIGEFLVQRGVITAAALHEAVEEQQKIFATAWA